MSNGKVKFSLSFVMLLVLVMSLTSAFALTKKYVKVDLTVKTAAGTVLNNGEVYNNIKAGDKIYVTASCNDSNALYWSQNTNFMSDKGYMWNSKGMALLGYMFDSTNSADYISSAAPTQLVITDPNYAVGSKHILCINAIGAVDGLVEGDFEYEAGSGTFAIGFTMPTTTIPETTVKVTTTNSSSTTVKATATVTGSTFSKFEYNWDNGAIVEVKTNPATIIVPSTIGTHKLTVKAVAADGKTATTTHYVTVSAPAVIDDELIVEDWMKENNSLEELTVSLRNDSDKYEKGNKNFYALNEEVVYYVDYKNGGDDITREVKLVLELPLDFKVIDAFGGTVNAKENTISWTFANGLEENESGTKVVKVAYTGFERSSKKYEIVYPVADIFERNKLVDSSAVINYIFKAEDVEITEEHYPYMQGYTDGTFRPDQAITRAEGALVLTRIFGIDISGTKIEPIFTDLDEVKYDEAKKAIVAASKLGLIDGYAQEDGTYKFTPNKDMTRAEFMKIIARYVELNAEEEDIRGLEIESAETAIKVYKNSKNKYMVGSSTVESHWAINEITMLTRLNMSPIGASKKSVELDKEISRAEVAQLVNLYLLRAPADVSSSTKTQFSDVSKKHKLFEDIVEATRGEHTYTITKEGYEVEVEIED